MRSLAIASVAVLLAGCGGAGDHYAPQPSGLIGFAGGVVTITPQMSTSAGVINGALVGATASIPVGALAQPVLVSITAAGTPAVGGFTAVGPAFTVNPVGTALVASATITITAPATPPATADMANVVVLLETPTGLTVLQPISATATAVAVAASAFGTFEAVLVTAIDPAGSTVTANPSTVPANGVTTASIAITVIDANGVGVPGAIVTLASTGSSDTIVQPGPTSSNGQATGTVASTTAETSTITVSVVPVSGGATTLASSATVTFQ